MNTKTILIGWFCCIGLVFWAAGCAVPQRFWPQDDIPASGKAALPGPARVLIASRSTEYKALLVAELLDRLGAEGISHETVGIRQLENMDTAGYDAVVVINTCLAWGLDHDVRTFMDTRQTTANIILLTTSGEGDWLPDRKDLSYDALSGASVRENIDDVARDLMARIRTRLASGAPTVSP